MRACLVRYAKSIIESFILQLSPFSDFCKAVTLLKSVSLPQGRESFNKRLNFLKTLQIAKI
ncbi:Uncharacterised protein [Actinobacillus suis]|nr:Uncharacterised protein [Actinobacillus suis]